MPSLREICERIAVRVSLCISLTVSRLIGFSRPRIIRMDHSLWYHHRMLTISTDSIVGDAIATSTKYGSARIKWSPMNVRLLRMVCRATRSLFSIPQEQLRPPLRFLPAGRSGIDPRLLPVHSQEAQPARESHSLLRMLTSLCASLNIGSECLSPVSILPFIYAYPRACKDQKNLKLTWYNFGRMLLNA